MKPTGQNVPSTKRPVRPGLLLVIFLAALTLGGHSVYVAEARESGRAKDVPPGSAQVQKKPWRGASGPVVTAIAGDVSLTTILDRGAVLQGGDGLVHVEVKVRTSDVAASGRATPSDVVVVLDRSGSMDGDKLLYAKEALRTLVGRLRAEDRFGLVVYDSSAQVAAPLEHADAAARLRWLRVIDRLATGASTNMSAGLDVGSRVIEEGRLPGRAARVLVLSDGLANAGDASLSGLVRRARRAVSGEYVLSAMGIGADFDEQVMTSLANAGTGGFYYLARLDSLPGFFDGELKTAQETYAQGAVLHFDAAPGVEVVSAMGLPLDRAGSRFTAPLGSLYAGHERTLWLTLKVPSHQVGAYRLGELGVQYRRNGTGYGLAAGELPKVDCVSDFLAFRNGIREDVWQRALINDEFTTARERFGDAIRTGQKQDLDDTLKRVDAHRRIAAALGNQAVLAQIDALGAEAKAAEASQRAPAPERNVAAKRSKAMGYQQRNRDHFLHADPMSSY